MLILMRLLLQWRRIGSNDSNNNNIIGKEVEWFAFLWRGGKMISHGDKFHVYFSDFVFFVTCCQMCFLPAKHVLICP
jgi:hypothetical protein